MFINIDRIVNNVELIKDQLSSWLDIIKQKYYSNILFLPSSEHYLSQRISRSQGKSTKNGYVIANDQKSKGYLPPVFIFRNLCFRTKSIFDLLRNLKDVTRPKK